MAWAVCPACRAVVDGAQEHAAVCSSVAAWVASMSGGATTSKAGPRWPDGVPVLAPPAAPDAAEESRAAVVRAQADDARAQITNQAIPALDAFLAGSPRLPTAGEYRALVTIVRGLAVAVRGLIRLATRALDSTDTED